MQVERPKVIESAPLTFSSKVRYNRQFLSPKISNFDLFVLILIPILSSTSLIAISPPAWLAAMFTLTFVAPSKIKVTSTAAKFGPSNLESPLQCRESFPAMLARFFNRGFLHDANMPLLTLCCQRYCRIAKERIQRELSQPELFKPAELCRNEQLLLGNQGAAV